MATSGAGDPACMQALRLVVYVTLWSGGHTLLAEQETCRLGCSEEERVIPVFISLPI
jgi:hypothetical protein